MRQIKAGVLLEGQVEAAAQPVGVLEDGTALQLVGIGAIAVHYVMIVPRHHLQAAICCSLQPLGSLSLGCTRCWSIPANKEAVHATTDRQIHVHLQVTITAPGNDLAVNLFMNTQGCGLRLLQCCE